MALGTRLGTGRSVPPLDADQLVQSPAFVVDLRGRNPAAFVREVEAEAAKIVGRYVPRTETLRSWDIHGSAYREGEREMESRIERIEREGERRSRIGRIERERGRWRVV